MLSLYIYCRLDYFLVSEDLFSLMKNTKIIPKANWHENGEKCSQYFCKLVKKNFIKKTITELIDDAGHHISDQSKILLQQHDFYKHCIQQQI